MSDKGNSCLALVNSKHLGDLEYCKFQNDVLLAISSDKGVGKFIPYSFYCQYKGYVMLLNKTFEMLSVSVLEGGAVDEIEARYKVYRTQMESLYLKLDDYLYTAKLKVKCPELEKLLLDTIQSVNILIH